MGGYPQVLPVTAILQNPMSDGHFGTCWYWLKLPFSNWGTEGREFNLPSPTNKSRGQSTFLIQAHLWITLTRANL